jgi:hypothetical protein
MDVFHDGSAYAISSRLKTELYTAALTHFSQERADLEEE